MDRKTLIVFILVAVIVPSVLFPAHAQLGKLLAVAVIGACVFFGARWLLRKRSDAMHQEYLDALIRRTYRM